MQYKNYTAKIEWDEEDSIFHGRVIGLRDYIVFEGTSVEELRESFRAAVDDYLAYCKARSEEPEKPYSGTFLVRVDPDLHRAISSQAKLEGKSLNAWMQEKLRACGKINRFCVRLACYQLVFEGDRERRSSSWLNPFCPITSGNAWNL